MVMKFQDNNEPTQREVEVIKLLYEGYSNKEIAQHLNIALRTVEHHLETAYQKLDAHGRVDAAIKAFKAGWISLVDDIKNEELKNNEK